MSADLWSQATDKLDDVYGALGAFSLKLAATNIRTYRSHAGFPAIEIDELGLYVRDTFEFTNTGKDQPLVLLSTVVEGDRPRFGPAG